jgi:hypothetical protein
MPVGLSNGWRTPVGRPVVDLLGGRGREPLAESGHPEHTEPGIARGLGRLDRASGSQGSTPSRRLATGGPPGRGDDHSYDGGEEA